MIGYIKEVTWTASLHADDYVEVTCRIYRTALENADPKEYRTFRRATVAGEVVEITLKPSTLSLTLRADAPVSPVHRVKDAL